MRRIITVALVAATSVAYRVYYPRSFLKFILLGFLLVSLPLLYALGELIYSLDRLATQSRQEVLQAAQAGRSSRLLFEQATTLERLARQQLILEDPALLEDYARVRQDFRGTTSQLAQLPLESRTARTRSPSWATARRGCTNSWCRRRARRTRSRSLADGYAQLVESAQGMLTATNQLTQRAIERLQETADQGREKWIYLALATVAHRAGARDLLRRADRAARSGSSTRRSGRWARRISRMRSRSTGRRTCAMSGNGWNGCARGCTNSKSSRTGSCVTCRMN